MKDLDRLETGLTAKIRELGSQLRQAKDGLRLAKSLRRLLNVAESTPAPLRLSPALQRKQRAASKEYWRKVKAGEIKRKGYKAND